jgi:glucosamine--fructose-6-phosphate aminotransferase (isomerizing)
MHLRAGREIAVASTKAFTAQGVCFALLALELARVRGTIDTARYATLMTALRTVPEQLEAVLQSAAATGTACSIPIEMQSCMFLGAGTSYALAGEAALKVQEVAYVHAHAFHLSEQKHGPLALVTPGLPVYAFVPSDGYEKSVGDALEVAHARGASIYTIGTSVPECVREKITADYPVPQSPPELFPLLAAPWVQLIAAHSGLARGNTIDLPRNLAKSVVV